MAASERLRERAAEIVREAARRLGADAARLHLRGAGGGLERVAGEAASGGEVCAAELGSGGELGRLEIERRAPFGGAERHALALVGRQLARLLREGGDADAFLAMLDVRVDPLRGEPAASGDARLGAVERGFAELDLPDALKRDALANLGQWLTQPAFEGYRPRLELLIEHGRWSLLLDSFYRVIPFGTGGRRGAVGIGTNRFNGFTLASSVQGHADYLRARRPDEDLSVVVVYDVREYHDLRGLYAADRPNPVLGVSSRDFARMAAEVYVANGVRVHLLPEDSTAYVATPELSFAIRELGATAGLNISASHNHPDDNGGKFYNQDGGQEVPPDDEVMARQVDEVEFLATLDFEPAKRTGLVSWIAPAVHEAYVDMNVAQSLRPDARGARVVFTPLHGTADATVGEVLRKAGFDVRLVPEESEPDGLFPSVPYQAPNPEVPESMERGIELARELEADVVMACDPDADRIGVVARTADGDYRFFNGNEISALVAQYKLEELSRQGRLPKTPLVIKTEVTTELLRPITEQYGGTLLGDLLVGFKYHGQILGALEREGRWGDVEAGLDDYIVGVEESHGVMVTARVRDKDAAGGAILLAELASWLREEGRTLPEYLDAIYARYGYHGNRLTSMVMTGAEGLANIQRIQAALRERPPEKVAEWRVTEHRDHWDEGGLHGAMKSETDRASRNVLMYRLENGARLIVRPSGTEPKNKVYIEVPAPPLGEDAGAEALARQKAETDAAALRIADDFSRQMLAVIDVHLPDWALRVSGLVPLDRRIDFAERFVPELEERAREIASGEAPRDDVDEWIDERLAAYGKDARGLVADAVAAYLEEERRQLEARGGDAARLELLGALETAFFRR